MLASRGIIPGIKVDRGAKPLALAPGETVTEGLDGLRERFAEYRELGARFAKWRATYSIGGGRPSEYCVWVNAHALARYAALAQEAGLVPIVEPEVLMDGSHSIDDSAKATGRAQQALYTELHDQRVDLRGTILKPNMVLTGYDAADRAGIDEVAERTLEVLYRHVPAAVPGICFLSGGQSDEDATANLNAMVKRGPHPWKLSFSYGRALQARSQHAWLGREENVEAAQRAYYHRARMNGAARTGTYTAALEAEADGGRRLLSATAPRSRSTRQRSLAVAFIAAQDSLSAIARCGTSLRFPPQELRELSGNLERERARDGRATGRGRA